MRALLLFLSLVAVAEHALALPRPGAPRPQPGGQSPSPLTSGKVRVAPDGEVRLGDRSLGRLELPAPPRRLEVREVAVATHRLLQIRVAGHGKRAAELVITAPPELKVLFRGGTGPQDVDGEWSRHVKLDEKGLLVFQRRDGLVRCDGAPVFLFPELYDFQAGRFRPVSAVVPRERVPELQAVRRPPAVPTGDPLNTFRLTGASTQAGDGQRAVNLSAPTSADDGRADTVWSESLGGSGRGEFLTAQAQRSPYRLKALRIIPGDAASARRFREANRLRSAVLHLSPSRSYRILFPSDPASAPDRPDEPFWVLLPEPVATTCATLLLDEVYPGRSARGGQDGQTAIAELRFFTELEFGGGLEQLTRDLDGRDERRGDAAVSVLIRLGGQGLEVAGRAVQVATGAALARRIRVIAAAGVPESAAPLARELPRLSGAARTTALDALERLGAASVPPLVALLGSSGQPENARAEAARVLGRIGGDPARQALLEAAGRGGEAIRAGVSAGLGALRDPADLAAVLQAAEADGPAARRADLINALGELGRVEPRATARRLAALWDRAGLGFEERYRILLGVGRLAPETELGLFERAAGSDDGVLRWMALEQARRVRGAGPIPAFRRALEDSYPPVRTSAALGLTARSADSQTARALAGRLGRERWPQVALAIAEAMGWHCGSEGVAALRRAVRQGPQGVDSRSLHSLARCQPPGLEGELLALAADREVRTSLRGQALSLLGPARSGARTEQLVRLFEELRREAARSDAGEAVAISAAGALGRAGGSAAVEALSDALALDPHEPIRAAAAIGLGRLCAAASREALERARSESASMVRRAADLVVRRCQSRWR